LFVDIGALPAKGFSADYEHAAKICMAGESLKGSSRL